MPYAIHKCGLILGILFIILISAIQYWVLAMISKTRFDWQVDTYIEAVEIAFGYAKARLITGLSAAFILLLIVGDMIILGRVASDVVEYSLYRLEIVQFDIWPTVVLSIILLLVFPAIMADTIPIPHFMNIFSFGFVIGEQSQLLAKNAHDPILGSLVFVALL